MIKIYIAFEHLSPGVYVPGHFIKIPSHLIKSPHTPRVCPGYAGTHFSVSPEVKCPLHPSYCPGMGAGVDIDSRIITCTFNKLEFK